MDNGIVQCFATAGYEVTLNDLSKDALDRAAATIEKNLHRMVTRNKIGPEEMECPLQNISLTNYIDSVGGCDLVIEAAMENEEVKSQIFDAFSQSLKPHTILATNTSSISVTRLASRTDRPEKFMGVHFMNPVPVMKLVELIRGIATPKDTFESVYFTIK